MHITYDPAADAIYIRFTDGRAQVTTEHLAEAIAADYDEDGRLVGIEILDAQKIVADKEAVRHVTFEEYPDIRKTKR